MHILGNYLGSFGPNSLVILEGGLLRTLGKELLTGGGKDNIWGIITYSYGPEENFGGEKEK